MCIKCSYIQLTQKNASKLTSLGNVSCSRLPCNCFNSNSRDRRHFYLYTIHIYTFIYEYIYRVVPKQQMIQSKFTASTLYPFAVNGDRRARRAATMCLVYTFVCTYCLAAQRAFCQRDLNSFIVRWVCVCDCAVCSSEVCLNISIVSATQSVIPTCQKSLKFTHT